MIIIIISIVIYLLIIRVLSNLCKLNNKRVNK